MDGTGQEYPLIMGAEHARVWLDDDELLLQWRCLNVQGVAVVLMKTLIIFLVDGRYRARVHPAKMGAEHAFGLMMM